jgi:hypothetical protein
LAGHEAVETGFGGDWNSSKRNRGFDGGFQLPLSWQFIFGNTPLDVGGADVNRFDNVYISEAILEALLVACVGSVTIGISSKIRREYLWALRLEPRWDG